MTPKEYIRLAAVTDHSVQDYVEKVDPRAADISEVIHYVLGLCTETGELQDAVKKYIAYGKPVDVVNIKEELGDLMWYIARLCATYGFTLEEVMETNINKLKTRYGEKFTENAALNRDLDKERRILES